MFDEFRDTDDSWYKVRGRTIHYRNWVLLEVLLNEGIQQRDKGEQ